MKVCSDCKEVFYCNKQCQKAGRKSHKFECKDLESFLYKDPSVILLARVLIKLTKDENIKDSERLFFHNLTIGERR